MIEEEKVLAIAIRFAERMIAVGYAINTPDSGNTLAKDAVQLAELVVKHWESRMQIRRHLNDSRS